MSILQSKSRSFSNFKAPITNRNPRDGVRHQAPILNGAVSWDDSSIDDEFTAQNLIIKQADTVKFTHVCRHYGIDLDEYNCKIQCPFKFHNDSDPSFHYYSKSNTFYCWGCKNNGGPVKFVSLLEDISKNDAADKLLDNFESEEADGSVSIKSKEKEELLLKFSAIIRNFLKENNTPHAMLYADKITGAFDAAMRGRVKREHERVVDLDGINNLISKLERRIGNYECP